MCLILLTLSETVDFTEERSKNPSVGQIIDEMNPRAADRDQDVGYGEVDEEIVSRRVHSMVSPHDVDDQSVPNQRQRYDGAVRCHLESHFIGRLQRFIQRIELLADVYIRRLLLVSEHLYVAHYGEARVRFVSYILSHDPSSMSSK